VQRPEEGKKCAYFYSLISEATSEDEYAVRRRNFLEGTFCFPLPPLFTSRSIFLPLWRNLFISW
jgi:hypothetical protein